MTTLCCLRFLVMCGMLLVLARGADIALSSGRVLKDARVVAISDKAVTILHKEGTESVQPGELDLEVLARASMDLEAKAKERKAKEAEVVAKLDARAAQAAQEAKERTQLARAFENAEAGVGSLVQLSPIPAERKLIAVKQSFPAQTKRKYQSKYEYMVPTYEVYSHYRGMTNVATLDSAPQVVATLRARLAEDIATYEGKANSARNPSMERAQYQATVAWLRGPMQAYLATFESTR